MALSKFQAAPGNSVKAFEAAAIEDNGEIKTVANGAFSGKIYALHFVWCWSDHLKDVWNSSPLRTVGSKVTSHINAS